MKYFLISKVYSNLNIMLNFIANFFLAWFLSNFKVPEFEHELEPGDLAFNSFLTRFLGMHGLPHVTCVFIIQLKIC